MNLNIMINLLNISLYSEKGLNFNFLSIENL